jgi:hypothetical protein
MDVPLLDWGSTLFCFWHDSQCILSFLGLLERVFLRIGSAETDEHLENELARFLTPVLLKLSSQQKGVREKVGSEENKHFVDKVPSQKSSPHLAGYNFPVSF